MLVDVVVADLAAVVAAKFRPIEGQRGGSRAIKLFHLSGSRVQTLRTPGESPALRLLFQGTKGEDR